MNDFTQLEAWKQSMDLAVKIHEVTKSFPREEVYGVTSQLRRASLSIPANTAEGFGRFTYPDKMHKYVQARGELIEVMTFLHYCERVRYLTLELRDSLLVDCTQIHRLLNGLIAKMRELDVPKS